MDGSAEMEVEKKREEKGEKGREREREGEDRWLDWQGATIRAYEVR